jgi:4-amino-4-deoxy-L-arabinose transferase-like glycosyltransferase
MKNTNTGASGEMSANSPRVRPFGAGNSHTAALKVTVVLAFAVHLAYQFNAALHHGSWGQDFDTHKKWIAEATANPWQFLWHFEGFRPDPPIFHLFCAWVYRLTGGIHSLEAIAILCALLNAGALFLAYRLLGELVESAILRVACIVFLLFLPCIMIHGIVLASDALTIPLFVSVIYLLTGLARPQSARRFLCRTFGISALLVIGVGTKFTLGSLVIASSLGVLVLGRAGLLPKRRFITALALVAFVPGLATLAEFFVYMREQGVRSVGINQKGSAMNLRSILFWRSHDAHILDAPPYDEKGVLLPIIGNTPSHDFNLLSPNKYSYPALLQLGIFTDIMNIYQFDPYDGGLGRRSAENQAKMRFAVRSGALFFLAGLLMTPTLTFQTFRGSVRGQRACVILTIIALAGLLYFFNIVAGLPFVMAYWGGYWLPRLILPALITFTLTAFVAADRFAPLRRPVAQWMILFLVIFQSALHASFLWPWGNATPMQPAISLVSPLNCSVLRASPVSFAWEPVAGAEDYWVDLGRGPAKGDILAGYTGGRSQLTVDLNRYLDGQNLYLQIYAKFPDTVIAQGTGTKFAFGTFAAGAAAAAREAVAIETLVLTGMVSFPHKPAGGLEALLTVGTPGAGDFFFVEYLSGDRVRFRYDKWGVGGPLGPEVPIVSGKLYPLTIRYNDDVVTYRLGDLTVFEHRTKLYPASRSEVAVGINRLGGTLPLEPFSGRLDVAPDGLVITPKRAH